jgi:hypothetical protein
MLLSKPAGLILEAVFEVEGFFPHRVLRAEKIITRREELICFRRFRRQPSSPDCSFGLSQRFRRLE